MIKMKKIHNYKLIVLVAILICAIPVLNAQSAERFVDIRDFEFQPADLMINVGDMVTWTNIDQVQHSSTSDDGIWDSGLLSHGQSFSFTFDSAGTFPYHCTPHPNMTGTITVSDNQCGCDIDMIPDNAPVMVNPGGSFTFTGSITNNCNMAKEFDVGVFVRLPDNSLYGPLYTFFDIPLSPGQTISVPGIEQEVPNFAPPGTYEYVAFCGMYPRMVHDEASFPFTVVSPAQSGADEWNLYGWFGEDTGAKPETSILSQNYPNPFNATTAIPFTLADDSYVNLSVYNLAGQLVEILVDGQMPAGNHNFNWDAGSVSSGVYFYKLETGHKVEFRKMNLVK